ncbi:MAG: hypothetical protein ACRD59_02800 [Candidatus Acidiferrales bacterium]
MEFFTGAITAVGALLLGIGLKPYLTGYSSKKGENLATHEDIEKLVDQVEAVTKATKRIETEIATGLWNKQKRWEMKREVLFEAARRVSEVDDAMLSYSIVTKEDHAQEKQWKAQKPSPEQELSWAGTKHEHLMRWRKVSTGFDESRAFVTIVCSKDAALTFVDLGAFMNNLAAAMTKDPDAYDKARPELFKKILIAQMTIRKELEVEA